MDRHGLWPRDDEATDRHCLRPRDDEAMDRHGLRPRDDGLSGIATEKSASLRAQRGNPAFLDEKHLKPL